MIDNYLEERSFTQLIGDAIFFEKCSRMEKDLYNKQRFARASIILSTLCLECGANCLLKNLQLSKQYSIDIDRLPFISKYDTFAQIGYDKSLDRGRKECQKVMELKQLRDRYVHSKTKKINLEFTSMEDVGENYKVNIDFAGKTKKAIGIDENSRFWFHKDAVAALDAIVSFFNYYFIDLLSIDKKDVFSLLSPLMYINKQPSAAFNQQYLDDEIKYLTSIGIQVNFII